jgi:hypothetical protein
MQALPWLLMMWLGTSLAGQPGGVWPQPVHIAPRFSAAGLAVDAQTKAQGVSAIMWNQLDQDNQLWETTTDDEIVLTSNGMCLDVRGKSTQPNTPVIVWQCNGQLNQKWSRVGFQLRPQHAPNMCLTIPGDGEGHGRSLEIAPCLGPFHHQGWEDVPSGTHGSGTPVLYAACSHHLKANYSHACDTRCRFSTGVGL